MELGDLYLVEIPASNGREQAGSRPALIIQDEKYQTQLPTDLIVPMTSKLAANAFPGTMTIQPDDENGLDMASVALVFQLRAIDKRRLKRQIGRLNLHQ